MKHNKSNGFSLIELAIVLGIVGVLMVGTVAGLGAIRETVKFKQDQNILKDVREALIDFANVNGYLPCPDTNGNGHENRETIQLNCEANSGTLPYLDLETHATNIYGLALSYAVNTHADTMDAFASTNSGSYFPSGNCLDTTTLNDIDAPCFKFDTPPMPNNLGTGNYTVQRDNTTGSEVFADHVPLVVISHGQNGCPGSAGFETFNCAANGNGNIFYQARQNRESFDDVITWISSQEIKTAIAATQANQRLPRRLVYDFANMDDIEDFIASEPVRYLEGRGGESAWGAREESDMLDEHGNEVDALLSVNHPNERVLLVPIADDEGPFEQYKITLKARYTDGGSRPAQGGYGLYFDTYLENETNRENAAIQKGYIYQFNRGWDHFDNQSRLFVRTWNIDNATTSTNSEDGPVDHYYPRFPVPESGTTEYADYVYERSFVPNRLTSPNGAEWWTEIYQTEIIVTGSGTDRTSNIRIIGWNTTTQDWSRLVAQFDYPNSLSTSWNKTPQNNENVAIQHLITDEDAQQYTGFRTWGTHPTEFHYLSIEEILD